MEIMNSEKLLNSIPDTYSLKEKEQIIFLLTQLSEIYINIITEESY